MSKIFVIPDVHLKPWILEEARKLINEDYDEVVMLGDVLDDWGKEFHNKLYKTTLQELFYFIEYCKPHYNVDIIFCYGNHELSYLWSRLESGFSATLYPYLVDRLLHLRDLLGKNLLYVYKKDNVIFSHAGITKEFVEEILSYTTNNDINIEDVDTIIAEIKENAYVGTMWNELSPIWTRPIYDNTKTINENYLQVVGHTPMEDITYKDGFLYTDVFSTHSDGTSLGSERFICVDTKEKTWEYVN